MKREKIIERLKDIYGDIYDYSLVTDCKSYSSKIDLVCKKHGRFTKTLRHLIYRNQSCNICNNRITNTKEFIIKANEIHNNKYNYSKTKYVLSQKNVIITCPIHGDFSILSNKHMSGRGCQKCGINGRSENRRLSKNIVINDFKKCHGSLYDYSKLKYTGTHDKVEVICKHHGSFWMIPLNHKRGQHCPKCANKSSKYEDKFISHFKNNKIKYKERKRNIISPYELDFYLPDHNLAIEVNGLYWHSELAGKDKNYHLNKTRKCLEKGINLIHYTDYQILKNWDIIMHQLNSILNINKRPIYARKCEVKEIDTKLKSKFLSKYHLQGNDRASVKLGLFYNNKLVSVMTFCKRRLALGKKESNDGEYELSRFCGNFNFYVIGGASKLLKYFERHYNPSKIVTYADKTRSNGNLYSKLGFTHIHDSQPNYWYFKQSYLYDKIYHRFSFRKSELKKKLSKFDPNKTEWENMQKNNWNRYWDCGNMVFEKNYE